MANRKNPDREPMNLPATSKVEFNEPEESAAPSPDDAYLLGDRTSEDDAVEQETQAAQQTNTVTTDQLAASQIQLATAVQALVDSQPVKRIPWSKFKTRSPFNPTGNRKRKLSRRCYQNGYPMDVRKLHDEEISLLNQMKPGKYFGGLVTAYEVATGGNVDLHIVYKNKSFDDRLALKSEFRNLREMLRGCVEQAANRGQTVIRVD